MAVNSDAVVEGVVSASRQERCKVNPVGHSVSLNVSWLLSSVSIAAPDSRQQARSGLGLDGVHVVSRKGRPSPLPASGLAAEAHPVSFACPSRATESFPALLRQQLVGGEAPAAGDDVELGAVARRGLHEQRVDEALGEDGGDELRLDLGGRRGCPDVVRGQLQILQRVLPRLRQLSVNFVDFHFFPRPK